MDFTDRTDFIDAADLPAIAPALESVNGHGGDGDGPDGGDPVDAPLVESRWRDMLALMAGEPVTPLVLVTGRARKIRARDKEPPPKVFARAHEWRNPWA